MCVFVRVCLYVCLNKHVINKKTNIYIYIYVYILFSSVRSVSLGFECDLESVCTDRNAYCLNGICQCHTGYESIHGVCGMILFGVDLSSYL